jgi:hypothetical protein
VKSGKSTALIEYAVENFENLNGVYNTLVVLSHLNYNFLDIDISSIRAFANKAKVNGPKTAARAQKLLDRLPN